MVTIKWKYLIIAAILILSIIGGLTYFLKKEHDKNVQNQMISESLISQKQLIDDIVRSSAQYASKKDIEAYAKSVDLNIKPIKEDLEKLDASVKGISTIRVITTGSSTTNVPSSNTETRKDSPTKEQEEIAVGYAKKKETLQLSEPFATATVPFGEVSFEAWKPKPWTLTVKPRNYQVVNVLGQDEEGRHYVYNRFTIEVDGKVYPIKINESKFVEELPKANFRFDPRLYASVGFGTQLPKPGFEANGSMYLSLFNYGMFKHNPSWNFLGLGFGYNLNNEAFGFLIYPANYNIGQHIPFTRNIYLGPAVGLDLRGGWSILGAMSFGL